MIIPFLPSASSLKKCVTGGKRAIWGNICPVLLSAAEYLTKFVSKIDHPMDNAFVTSGVKTLGHSISIAFWTLSCKIVNIFIANLFLQKCYTNNCGCLYERKYFRKYLRMKCRIFFEIFLTANIVVFFCGILSTANIFGNICVKNTVKNFSIFWQQILSYFFAVIKAPQIFPQIFT